ncbi:hypothetical protein KL920_005162 [Ogataea angusta]|nr:hypothetical protein KL920_005162 [Ogataea angusta]
MAAELGKPQSQSKYIQDEPDATRRLGGSLQAAQAAHSFSSGVSGSGFCGASLAWWPIRSRSFSGISSNARSSGVKASISIGLSILTVDDCRRTAKALAGLIARGAHGILQMRGVCVLRILAPKAAVLASLGMFHMDEK